MRVVMDCTSVEAVRRVTGFRTTINLGLVAGVEKEMIFANLLNGVGSTGNTLLKRDFMDVGRIFNVLLVKWWSLW